ncbi:MAG: hypothetical protein RL685_4230 [Pseudomonadota bacterium]|jgi:hypothetical protein
MKDPLDLASLDPSRRDPARWERRIQSVVARAVAAQRWTVARQLSSWARPAMALAAAAALFSWLGLMVTLRTATTSTSTSTLTLEQDPHALLSSWAATAGSGDTAAQPTVGTLLTVLGER